MTRTGAFFRAARVAALAACFFFGCRREGAVDADVASDPAEAADTGASGEASGDSLRGRLAFGAVRPGANPTHHWSPAHPTAEVVVFAEGWPEPPGHRFLAVALGFTDTVRFAGVTEAPYGCDAVETSMAAFEGARDAPEGPVWLAPFGSSVEAVPLEEMPVSGTGSGRAWRVGELVVTLMARGARAARITFTLDGLPLWSNEFETYSMGEGEPPALDLNGFAPGIPIPIAAFRAAGGRLPLVVLWRPGYEGNAFDLLRADLDRPLLEEGEPVYFCAY